MLASGNLRAPTLAHRRTPNLTEVLISKATYLVWDNFLEIRGISVAHVATELQILSILKTFDKTKKTPKTQKTQISG